MTTNTELDYLTREVAEAIARLTWDIDHLEEGIASIANDPEIAVRTDLPCPICMVPMGTAMIDVDGNGPRRMCHVCMNDQIEHGAF